MRKPKTPLLPALLVLLSFAALRAGAQQPFEGKITYELMEGTAKPGVLTILFSPKGMRCSFALDGVPDHEEILTIFDSSATVELNNDSKTYSIRYTPPLPVGLREEMVIAGYRVKPYSSSGKLNPFSDFGTGSITYMSDELVCRIPEHLLSSSGVMMVDRNRIVLALFMPTERKDTFPSFDAAWNSPTYRGLMIRAKSVEPARLDPSLFMIPATYTRNPDADLTVYDDSTIAVIDSTAQADAPDPAYMMLDTSAAVYTEEPVKKSSTRKTPASKKKPAKQGTTSTTQPALKPRSTPAPATKPKK